MKRLRLKKDNPNQGYKCGFVIMVLALLFVAFPGWMFEHSAKTQSELTDTKNMNTALIAQLNQEDMELQKLKLQIHEQIKAAESTKAAAKKQTSLPVVLPIAISFSNIEQRVRDLTAQVWGRAHIEAMVNIVKSESNFRPNALNPNGGACGIPQALPCSKMGCGLTNADVDCQLNWMVKYISDRYGNPIAAWSFHLQKGWY